MKIVDWKEFLAACLKPGSSVVCLTFWTGTVAIVVIRVLFVATVVTLEDMPTHGLGATVHDIPNCTTVAGQHCLTKYIEILFPVTTKYVSQFDHETRYP